MERIQKLLAAYYGQYLGTLYSFSNHERCKDDFMYCDAQSLTQYAVDLARLGFYLLQHPRRLFDIFTHSPAFKDFLLCKEEVKNFTEKGTYLADDINPNIGVMTRENYDDEEERKQIVAWELLFFDRAAHKFHWLVAPIHSFVMYMMFTHQGLQGTFDRKDYPEPSGSLFWERNTVRISRPPIWSLLLLTLVRERNAITILQDRAGCHSSGTCSTIRRSTNG